jgi:8-oxo-dGTP pyrophosphatase MutT (NUDIX family)
MKWKFKTSKKDTNHPFLNLYVVEYEVTKDDGSIRPDFPYFVASRNQKDEELRINKQDFKRADAVLVGAYTIRDGQLFLLLERQFRPALNHDVVSFPAGLCDKEDKDIVASALRELREETGYTATDFEMIVPPSPTSEGLSDECNAVVICRLLEKGEDAKEEFEDLSAKLYSVKEVQEMLKDETILFSNSARILVLYLLEKFKNR